MEYLLLQTTLGHHRDSYDLTYMGHWIHLQRTDFAESY